MITINNTHNIGDTVFILHYGNIIADTIKSITIYEFTLDARNPTPTIKPRYRLENTSGTFFDADLYNQPQDIIKHLQQQIKNIA